MELKSDGLLQEQLDYYSARAPEYDQWWHRQGRYDRGEAVNRQWFDEGKQLESALLAAQPRGKILELACGTGLWTRHLAACADEMLAVDGSAEMLRLNAQRLAGKKIRYQQANLFDWQPDACFDFIFFGFWLSHVPPDKFGPFWQMVASALSPQGTVFFVDSKREVTSTALNHDLPSLDSEVAIRRLDDGREFQVLKIFYPPHDLQEQLAGLGWKAKVNETARYFIYGQADRR